VTPPIPPRKSSKAVQPAVKYYLVAYNLLSALGWAFVLILTVIHLFDLDGNSSSVEYSSPRSATSTLARFFTTLPFVKSSSYAKPSWKFEKIVPALLVPVYQRAGTTFARVGVATAAVQTCAILEVLHALLGWVRSPIQTTVIQVSSRLILVWGITEQFPETRTNPLYASMVFAWSFTEVIRYVFYALNLLGRDSSFLTYLRYTTFYILYPMGASSEAFLMYSTLPRSSPIPSFQSWAQGMWRPTDYIRGAMFLIWWPGLYFMYTYMISQRRKVIGPPAGHRLGGKKTKDL
jgi:very-long-chain (3R)-3-hydroxyacyl-CoA dehydratase